MPPCMRNGEWLYEFIDDETKAVTDFIRFPDH